MGNNDGATSWRAVFSTCSAFAMLFLLISGVALYVAPPCRVAESTGWVFLGIGKDSWEAVHLLFAVIFVLFSLVHLVLNWTVFARYAVNKSGGNSRPQGLFALIAVLAFLLFLLSAFRLPPAVWVHDAHERIKASYIDGAAPGHGHGRGGRFGGQYRLERP